MLNVNVMEFLHNEETKMSTVRATSRVLRVNYPITEMEMLYLLQGKKRSLI